MRRFIVFTLIVGLFFLSYFFFRSIFAYTDNLQIKSVTKQTLEKEIIQDQLWSLIQDWRKQNNFQPYIKNQELCRVAEDRANDILILDNHKGLYKKYSSYPFVLQENLSSLEAPNVALSNWLSSPPHRSTLEKPYIYSCIICDKQCVQIFSSFEK